MIRAFLASLFKPSPVLPPDDLVAFDAARKRLRDSSRALAREADKFGELVRGIQGPKSRKPCATKKRKRAAKS